MAKCSTCGNEFKDGELFCTVCGSPAPEDSNIIDTAPADKTEDTPVIGTETEVTPDIPENEISAQMKEEETINAVAAAGEGYFEVTDDSAEIDLTPSEESTETLAEETPAEEATEVTYDVPALCLTE